MTTSSFFLADENETLQLGMTVAKNCVPPCTIYLYGELGAGKTTFCRGFLRQLGHTGAVKSPTYTLVEPYSFAQYNVYHFDLYRLTDPEELEYMGIRDYFDSTSIRLIEWAKNAQGSLPSPDITITLEYQLMSRCISLNACSEKGQAIIDAL